MERVYSLIAIIIGIIFLISLLGQSIKITHNIPPTAIVYVDEGTHIYYAPPYILGKKYPSTLDVNNIKGKTVSESEQNNFKADPTCVELGYFKEQDTLTHTILVKLGLSKPNQADGIQMGPGIFRINYTPISAPNVFDSPWKAFCGFFIHLLSC
jgi:hypothetical protein